MAQTGYSKVQIYSSSTATNTPSASNLTNDTNGSELAINITDGKLFYKDNSGTVQVLATKGGAFGTVTSVAATVPSFLSISGSPITSSGTLAITLSGTALPTTSGGTGLTSFTANGVVYASSTSALTTSSALVFDGANLGVGVTSITGGYKAQINGNLLLGPAANPLLVGTTSLNFIGDNTSSSGMRLDSSGNLLVGVTTAFSGGSKIMVAGNTSSTNPLVLQDTGTSYSVGNYYVYFINSTNGGAGSIAHTGVTTVAYQTSSDARLKENVVDAPSALEKINQTKVRSFDWKEDGTHVDYGFIAQELYQQLPEAVGKGDDETELTNPKGTWQVEYGRLTPMLVKAIQELSAQVTTLQTQVTALQTKVSV